MIRLQKGFAVVVVGPSGAGKSTLAKRIVQELEHCRFSVSDTSRAMRKGETDGVDYNFIDEATFQKRMKSAEYAEYAIVHGDYKGTPRSEIEKAHSDGVTLLLDIDVQGCDQIKDVYPETLGIFIVPPSLEVLERRLRGRGTDSELVVRTRLENAKHELERMFAYDYIVINDDLDEAVSRVLGIIRAERWRASRLETIEAAHP